MKEKYGLQVVAQADNGLEAVQMADQTIPDVILMDITMSEMDGIAATEKILKKHSWVRIIGLSMHDDPSIEEKMRRAGACDYIYKAATPSGWKPGKVTLKPSPELVGKVWEVWKSDMAFD